MYTSFFTRYTFYEYNNKEFIFRKHEYYKEWKDSRKINSELYSKRI